MGKNKSGKKGGKKKGGKKKKTAEPQITWQEALIAYRINLKENQLQDSQYDLKMLKDKNERLQERNKRLKTEQTQHMKNLLKQNKEFQKKLDSERVVDKEEVIEVMKEKWEVARQESKSLQELRHQIRATDAQIIHERKRVAYWNEYKEKGQHDHHNQIELLEMELVDMQRTFDEMKAHLEHDLHAAKSEIKTKTDEKLDKQKHEASEKAISRMDKYSRQEVLDNDWLKREVEIHKREAGDLMCVVDEMEKENLSVMGDLFECHVDDLKISRNFYLTQFAEDDNIDEGILELDLSKLSFQHRDAEGNLPVVAAAKQGTDRPARPKSAKLQYIEDKVLSLATREEQLDSDQESDYDGKNSDEDSTQGDPFNNYFYMDDEDFDDYLKLGPLELKLLNISGQQMCIHHPKALGPEEMRTKNFKPDLWPVNKAMLKKVTKVK